MFGRWRFLGVSPDSRCPSFSAPCLWAQSPSERRPLASYCVLLDKKSRFLPDLALVTQLRSLSGLIASPDKGIDGLAEPASLHQCALTCHQEPVSFIWPCGSSASRHVTCDNRTSRIPPPWHAGERSKLRQGVRNSIAAITALDLAKHDMWNLD
ncbi:hypothetical protein RRG08_036575 [Elysia crispata]|uniref:Uncharacterized protein n=1 Tax=Elysia crispata TaxID=231223 RepID=A0AAE0ZQT8_9GAST|nr:hypothetical protein RRG08_036575 [Elysia crispata]